MDYFIRFIEKSSMESFLNQKTIENYSAMNLALL